MVDQGDVVPVSAPIAVVGEEGEEVEAPAETPEKTEEKKEEKPASEPAPQPASTQQTSSTPEGDRIKASPLAKKMASDKNIDLANLEGSGPGGRIVKKDVEAALESGPAAGKPSAPSAVSTMVSGEDETVQLTKLRQAIARRMTDSKTSVPHFYVTHEYNMDAVMAMRKQANEYLSDDEKLSVNDFIIKSVALALREFPNLNASFGGEQVIRHGNINIGIAVAVEGGLLTVVNKNTDQQLLRAISGDIKQKVARARDGKVKPDDIEGSTFSISNMGMFDVEHFIAIINPPEAAIIAVGSARQVPVVEDGEIKPGWRMKATISVDHRVSDGAEAAQFMQALAGYLENPVSMLI
jgi:pyruvate dehydrogenase E2 component (dihydrolipoamide acetyltransferase)